MVIDFSGWDFDLSRDAFKACLGLLEAAARAALEIQTGPKMADVDDHQLADLMGDLRRALVWAVVMDGVQTSVGDGARLYVVDGEDDSTITIDGFIELNEGSGIPEGNFLRMALLGLGEGFDIGLGGASGSVMLERIR